LTAEQLAKVEFFMTPEEKKKHRQIIKEAQEIKRKQDTEINNVTKKTHPFFTQKLPSSPKHTPTTQNESDMYITEFPYPDHVMADRIPTLEPNVNNINYFDETEFILDITKENSNMPKLISQFTELENDMPPLIINETSVKDLPTHLELPFLTQTPIITKTEVKPITTRLTKYVSLPVNDNIEDEASESNKYLKQIYNSYLEILSTQYNMLCSTITYLHIIV